MLQRRVDLYLHFAWTTWDRARLLTPARRDRVYAVIAAVARAHGCLGVVVGGGRDELHVLVRAPPSIVPAALVGEMKGASSRVAHAHAEDPFPLWWSQGYALVSVDPRRVHALVREIVGLARRHGGPRTLPPPLPRR
jgi:REP element-mobilizing transposase RayT